MPFDQELKTIKNVIQEKLTKGLYETASWTIDVTKYITGAPQAIAKLLQVSGFTAKVEDVPHECDETVRYLVLGLPTTENQTQEWTERLLSVLGAGTSQQGANLNNNDDAQPLSNNLSDEVKRFINSLGKQPEDQTNQRRLKSANSSVLKDLRCPIMRTVPNTPVLLKGRIYDFDSLYELQVGENGSRLDPVTGNPFWLSELQPGRVVQDKIERRLKEEQAEKKKQPHTLKTNNLTNIYEGHRQALDEYLITQIKRLIDGNAESSVKCQKLKNIQIVIRQPNVGLEQLKEQVKEIEKVVKVHTEGLHGFFNKILDRNIESYNELLKLLRECPELESNDETSVTLFSTLS